jgi:hypothetical protein
MADQALCVRGHGQVPVPTRILRHEERSSSGRLQRCGYRVISQNGALFATRAAPLRLTAAAGSRHPWHLNPPHPAGAARRHLHGRKPAAQHAERTKNR